MKYCHNCGEQIDEKAVICVHCGVRQAGTSSGLDLNLGEKNRTTAGLLALLLGGIGIHKFYLGNSAAGIIYLLFFWTFIPAILALIEGISLLSMSDEEFAAKYI